MLEQSHIPLPSDVHVPIMSHMLTANACRWISYTSSACQNMQTESTSCTNFTMKDVNLTFHFVVIHVH